jgi:hypothetical protein
LGYARIDGYIVSYELLVDDYGQTHSIGNQNYGINTNISVYEFNITVYEMLSYVIKISLNKSLSFFTSIYLPSLSKFFHMNKIHETPLYEVVYQSIKYFFDLLYYGMNDFSYCQWQKKWMNEI